MNKYGVAKAYDPYPEDIYIYGNRFTGGGSSPDGLDLKTLKLAMYGLGGRLPDILWDGYYNKDRKVDGKPAGLGICVDNGAAHVLNADGPGGYKNPVDDAKPFQCTLPKLPAVELGKA
jgi:hypothetical protein